MIKHVNGYKMSKKLENCKAYVKIFSGSLHERSHEGIDERKA